MQGALRSQLMASRAVGLSSPSWTLWFTGSLEWPLRNQLVAPKHGRNRPRKGGGGEGDASFTHGSLCILCDFPNALHCIELVAPCEPFCWGCNDDESTLRVYGVLALWGPFRHPFDCLSAWRSDGAFAIQPWLLGTCLSIAKAICTSGHVRVKSHRCVIAGASTGCLFREKPEDVGDARSAGSHVLKPLKCCDVGPMCSVFKPRPRLYFEQRYFGVISISSRTQIRRVLLVRQCASHVGEAVDEASKSNNDSRGHWQG